MHMLSTFVLLMLLAFSCTDRVCSIEHSATKNYDLPFYTITVDTRCDLFDRALIRLKNGPVLNTGFLPLGVSAGLGETIVAEYEVYQPYFNVNYPELNPERIAFDRYRCYQEMVVENDTTWLIGVNDWR